MKILGIDYGEKRIGLAISDETQTFARELTILSPKEFWEQVNKLISDQEISKIVLGWPLNMSGQPTEKTREVESFRKKLIEKLSAKSLPTAGHLGGSATMSAKRTLGGKVESETGLQVEIIDERLSSQMAEHIIGGKKDVDSLAAQILLQNYLDRSKN